MLRILVVDDSSTVRRAICTLLLSVPEFCVVGEAADGIEAIERAQALQPDVILLDIQMPSMNGFEAAPKLFKASPRSLVVFLTQYSSRRFAVDSIHVGAHGYVVKARAAQDLIKAIHAAASGRFFTSAVA